MTQEKTTPQDFLGIRTKREALGMTLKDVFALTRISTVNLEAIENGDFADLPVPIYTKNFIKTYAQALGLDSKPILDSYEAYLNSLQIEQTPVCQQEAAPEPEQEPFFKKLAPYKVYIMVASVLIIVAVVGVIVFQQQQPLPTVTGNQQPVVVSAPQIAANTPATQSVAPPVNLPAQSGPTTLPKAAIEPPVAAEAVKQAPLQQKNPDPVKPLPKQNVLAVEKKAPVPVSEGNDLVIRATEETWLKIKIDQNPSFQFILKPGEVLKRKGAEFDVNIGNAGGITVQFKGKVIENLGKSGEVVHLRLP
jgi:cytoskeleton protein RodZ